MQVDRKWARFYSVLYALCRAPCSSKNDRYYISVLRPWLLWEGGKYVFLKTDNSGKKDSFYKVCMISIVAFENTILWRCLIVWADSAKGVLFEEKGRKKQTDIETKPIGIDGNVGSVFYYANVTWL